MYIYEAIAARTREKPYIARKDWGYVVEGDHIRPGYAVKLNPTNTPDLCVVISKTSGMTRGWEPSAADLTADDWITVR